jgi:hypothetical protein
MAITTKPALVHKIAFLRHGTNVPEKFATDLPKSMFLV